MSLIFCFLPFVANANALYYASLLTLPPLQVQAMHKIKQTTSQTFQPLHLFLKFMYFNIWLTEGNYNFTPFQLHHSLSITFFSCSSHSVYFAHTIIIYKDGWTNILSKLCAFWRLGEEGFVVIVRRRGWSLSINGRDETRWISSVE